MLYIQINLLPVLFSWYPTDQVHALLRFATVRRLIRRDTFKNLSSLIVILQQKSGSHNRNPLRIFSVMIMR